MKNFTKVVCSCFVAGMFIMIALGCASQKTFTYDVCLTTVEAPADAKEQFGESRWCHLQMLNSPSIAMKMISLL